MYKIAFFMFALMIGILSTQQTEACGCHCRKPLACYAFYPSYTYQPYYYYVRYQAYYPRLCYRTCAYYPTVTCDCNYPPEIDPPYYYN